MQLKQRKSLKRIIIRNESYITQYKQKPNSGRGKLHNPNENLNGIWYKTNGNITCTVYIKIYIVFTIQIKTKNITMFDWL